MNGRWALWGYDDDDDDDDDDHGRGRDDDNDDDATVLSLLLLPMSRPAGCYPVISIQVVHLEYSSSSWSST